MILLMDSPPLEGNIRLANPVGFCVKNQKVRVETMSEKYFSQATMARLQKAILSIGAFGVFVVISPKESFSHDSTNPEKYHITSVHVDRKVALTGRLSDPLWKLCEPAELDYEIQPGENVPARQRTLVYVLYNSDYVYFGFNSLDSSAKEIRSHVTDRDKMTDDDFVGVILDCYGTMQNGYEFFANPYGIQFDAMRTSNNEDASFDAVWMSLASVNDSGYTVEIAVPFKSMRFPPNKEQHWMAEFVRNMPRQSRYQMTWTPIDRNNPCILCQGGTIDGIGGIESSDNLELLPYVMGAQTGLMSDVEDPTSKFSNGPVTGRIGAGIKYSPSSSLMLGAVVNPDFSQIESDATQISVNNTFAVFYPEKRPFFLEGADLYNSTVSIFYSRMINDPLVSAKATEKSGAFSLAYLAAEDRNSPVIVPGEEGSDFVETSMKSFSNIARARFDLGSESFVGALATMRNFSKAHNYVGSLDWNFLFLNNFYFMGQAAYSDTKEINDTSIFLNDRHFGATGHTASFDGERYMGTGMQVDFKRNAKDYSFDLSYSNSTPTFQAQDGFITGTGNRNISLWHGYTIYPSNYIIDNASLQMNGGYRFDDVGIQKERWMWVGAYALLKSQTNLYVGFIPFDNEMFHNVRFGHIYHTEFSVNSNPSSTLAIYFNGSVGRFIYRSDDPELGRGHNFYLETVIKPTEKFSLDLSYARSRLWSVNTGELFYDGYIARGVIVYQFSPELFVRLINQYDQFAKHIQFDPMVSYKLNPFTVFYAGSNHDFSKFGMPYGIERTTQQFFVKIQYLWQN
jgi:Domain of unknown function (DUF5916)/Carbohydrate family 9 binding domain-like